MPRNWSWGKKRDSGYRSKEEERVAEWLTNNNVKFTYETVKLEYNKPVRKGLCLKCGSTTSSVQRLAYSPDFILDSGTIIEYKGRLTSKDRTKLVAVKKANPDVKLVLLFGSDNKIDKRSTKRYSQWATGAGFDYAIRIPPARWLRSASDSKG